MILSGLRKTQSSFLVVQPLGISIGTFRKKRVPFRITRRTRHTLAHCCDSQNHEKRQSIAEATRVRHLDWYERCVSFSKLYSQIHLCYVPKEARLMDPFAKTTPLFWWQTTPCNTKEHRSQILETVRILPFAKHIIVPHPRLAFLALVQMTVSPSRTERMQTTELLT